MKFPTMDELNAAYAEEERKARERYFVALARQELIKKDTVNPEPVPGITQTVDVATAARQPNAVVPTETLPTQAHCDGCGRVFTVKQYRTIGMAKAQRGRHQKKCPEWKDLRA